MKLTCKYMLMGFAGLALAVAGIASGAGAQTDQSAPPPPPPPGAMHRMAQGPGGPGEEMRFLGFEMGLEGKTVTGAPFTATFSTQTTQALSDGNQIQRTTTGTIARDSEGRTRRDMTLPAIGTWATSQSTPPHVTFLNDPVAGTRYILEPDRKIAREMASPRADRRGRNSAEGMARRGGEGKNVVTTDLGTQAINGVTAQGTRYTRTIPAGAIGNEKPIVIVTERWYSPDLQIDVMTKHSDPRNGETVTQLTNIQKAEPDATLFQVPSDYTVRQGPRMRARTGGPAGAPAQPEQ
jgi:hypothetical protein